MLVNKKTKHINSDWLCYKCHAPLLTMLNCLLSDHQPPTREPTHAWHPTSRTLFCLWASFLPRQWWPLTAHLQLSSFRPTNRCHHLSPWQPKSTHFLSSLGHAFYFLTVLTGWPQINSNAFLSTTITYPMVLWTFITTPAPRDFGVLISVSSVLNIDL